MLKIKTIATPSAEWWIGVIRGMRNPKNSWDRMDSHILNDGIIIGPNDMKLMKGLCNGGPVHAKFRRQLPVILEIDAPLYWWKEFDTYRVGVAPNPTDIEENSCSTMHKITEKKFTLDDFAHEHLADRALYTLAQVIDDLNDYRAMYMAMDHDIKNDVPKDPRCRALDIESRKNAWWNIIQLLPSSYIQKRTVTMTYEALAGAYFWRQGHKQDEWRDQFCPHILTLPYAEDLIACKKANPLAD